MKLTTGILGCALVAGLMTFAADNAQAGVMINNALYSPLSLKLTIGVYNSKGQIKKVSVTSKQILKTLDLPKGSQLAINTGNVENNEVYVITKDSVVGDLTANGILTADLNELLDSGSKGDSKFKYQSSGVLTLNFYSDPQFVIAKSAAIAISNPDIDQAASEEASDYWFEISGQYAYSVNASVFDNHSQLKLSTNLKANELSGMGYDADLDSDYPTTVAGNVSAKGNGKVPAISIY